MFERVDDDESLMRQAARCFVCTVALLFQRRLHIGHRRVRHDVVLDDGRRYVVFRETSCDTPTSTRPVTLVVWFRLRAIPPGARLRRRIFERACIVNTLLFAGVPGYVTKLWMVNPPTSDYAGLYSWRSASEAESYGRYITSILRPLSARGSIGFNVVADRTLDEYLGASESSTQDAKNL